MGKIIKCSLCGYQFEESAWSKTGRYGLYVAEGAVKFGAQLAVAFLTRGRGTIISNMAGNAAEGITGDPRKFDWGDLACPKCGRKIVKP